MIQCSTNTLLSLTYIAAAPLFTLCLKQPTAAPAPPFQKSPVCSDWSDHSVVIGQLLTAVLEMEPIIIIFEDVQN